MQMMRKASVLMLLVGLLVGCTAAPPLVAPAGQAASAPATLATPLMTPDMGETGHVMIEGDEALLRPLVEGWLSLDYSDIGLKTRLLLGRLPENLAFSLALPSGSTVIGSVVNDDLNQMRIYVAVPLAAQQAITYFTDNLVQQGLAALPSPEDSAAFGQPDSRLRAMLCSDADGATLYLTAVPSPDDAQESNVSLSMVTYRDEACRMMQSPQPPAADWLPHLPAPAGARIETSGSGAQANTEVDAYAVLTVAMSVAELADHYEALLHEAGWTLVRRTGGDGVAWSSWQFEDKAGQPWAGTLIISERPARVNGVFVELRAERSLR